MIGEMALERLSPRQPKPPIAMSTVEAAFPVERLWDLYEYNPITGQLISKRLGRPISTKERKRGHSYGRVNFRIDGACFSKSMQATIWAWCTGAWPSKDLSVDHINRDRTDNRFQNLRLATPREQAQNQAQFCGGVRQQGNSWVARIYRSGKVRHIGCYPTEAEAKAAYLEQQRIL